MKFQQNAKTFAPLTDQRTVENPWGLADDHGSPWVNIVRRDGIQEWQDFLTAHNLEDPTVQSMRRATLTAALAPVTTIKGFRNAKKQRPEKIVEGLVDTILAQGNDPAAAREQLNRMKEGFARILWTGGAGCPLSHDDGTPFDLSKMEDRLAVLMFNEGEDGQAYPIPMFKIGEDGKELLDEDDEPIQNECAGLPFGDGVFQHLTAAAKEQEGFRVKFAEEAAKNSLGTPAGS